MKENLSSTVDLMVRSLEEYAEIKGISDFDIKEIFSGNSPDVNDLDNLFDDGGEARCEHFIDHAMDYALTFGEFDGEEFHDAMWEAIKLAMKRY